MHQGGCAEEAATAAPGALVRRAAIERAGVPQRTRTATGMGDQEKTYGFAHGEKASRTCSTRVCVLVRARKRLEDFARETAREEARRKRAMLER